MVNADDFIKRLELILDYYSLSASTFADKIGVQRSSLSHLLSGRNKPSLDFILKIIEAFPEVDLYWILNGTGSFPKSISNEVTKNSNTIIVDAPTPISIKEEQGNLFNEVEKKETVKEITTNQNRIISSQQSKIERIVIFYTDGKFEEYNPK